MKRIIILVLTLCLLLSSTSVSYAAEQISSEPDRSVSTLLDNLSNTQTITGTEKEVIESMLEKGYITRENLNEHLLQLSVKTRQALHHDGYTDSQVDMIKSYKAGEDAFDHVFSRSIGAELTGRYGLAGTGTQARVIFAFEFTWSSCPVFTFVDSFGIGWNACDINSHSVSTTVISHSARVDYYQVAQQAGYVGYRNLALVVQKDNCVTGNPALADVYNLAYGKKTSGSIVIQTQATSYNMTNIEFFVEYYHSMDIPIDGDYTINVGDSGLSFSAGFHLQDMVLHGHKNFAYNDSGVYPIEP